MKPMIKLMMFALSLNANLLAQSGWLWQNPQPQGNALGDIHIFDQNTALAVGEAGTVMKTTDGGMNWRMQHYAGGTTEYLASVFFIDNNTGWAVGSEGTILKTTNGGSTWSAQTSGTTETLHAVFFVDANTGWAVGGGFLSEGIILKTTNGGIAWSVQISGTPGELYSVSFIDDTTGWAVGRRGTILKTTDGGTTWSAQTSGTTLTLKSVYFLDANTGWAVGGGFFEGIKLKTTDGGSTWSLQISGTTSSLESVRFMDANTGWTVGNFGTILKTTNGGSTWSAQSNGTTKNLESVYFVDANIGWAVGGVGTILKTTNGGSTWSAQASGTTDDLSSVHFVDANTGWTVGIRGTILKTTDGGNSWSAQTSGTTRSLFSAYFTDTNTGWAVGGFSDFEGVILKTTNGGSTWSAQSSGTKEQLNSVFFVDANTGWAVGGLFESVILKTIDGGSTWSAQTSRMTRSFFSVYFTNVNTGWAVGDGGTILKTSNGGSTWSAQTSGTTYSLHSIYFVPQGGTNTGWAVGGVGTILKSANGGSTWSAQTSGTANDLKSVYFIPQGGTNTGWAVGIEGTILKATSGETAILNVDVPEVAIQARSNETATSTFMLSNSGTADLSFNITASGPTSSAPTFSAILKARSAGSTNFSSLQPPSLALNETTGEKPPTSQAQAVQAQTGSVTSLAVVGDDVLFLDDGDDTADSFIGLRGAGETYWRNRFVPSGNGFQLERILVFIRTESVPNPSFYVAVAVDDGQLLVEENVTLPSARDGAWYEIGLPAPLSFGSGQAFYIILGGPETIAFPAGVDQNARVPNNSFYLEPTQNRYVPLGTIRGFENGAFLIRAVGSETGDRLTVNPASGTISPGSSQTITVTLNAQRLATGNYQSQLSITSNGGNHTVPVRVRVSPAANVAELAYDNGVSTSGYYWPRAGQGSAVRFTPSSRTKLKQAKIFIRNIADGNQFNLRVLAGANGAPGNTIYGPIPVTVPDTGWVKHDLSAANISVNGDFYIMIEYNGTSEPTFGSEKAPPLEKRSWDFDGSEWTLFDTEDYLIRAVVEYTTGVAARDDDASLPQTFGLLQNFPNPFNPETHIRYELPYNSNVTLAVFDLTGRHVATLDTGVNTAGEYTVSWNGRDNAGNRVPSGIYFYRLEARTPNGTVTTLTKKMTVMK